MENVRGTLLEQINELIATEQEIVKNDMSLALQVFGAETDENGVVKGGQRGFRVLTNTTETDSLGTAENESTLTDSELLKSAWKEVENFERKVRIGVAQRTAFKFELLEREQEIVTQWEDGIISDEEANGQLDCLRGCLADYTDKDINAYFVERELDESSPELLGFKFEAPTFNRLFDETDKEYVQWKETHLEDRNWPHLQAMDDLRVRRFEWMKVKIRTVFDECNRLRKLGYSVIYRESLREFMALRSKISEARDYSFASKLLDSLIPSMKKNPWWMKRNFYLKLDLQRQVRASGKKFVPDQHLNKKDIQAYSVYNESRGLTFEQHKLLMEGWNKMEQILNPKV